MNTYVGRGQITEVHNLINLKQFFLKGDFLILITLIVTMIFALSLYVSLAGMFHFIVHFFPARMR